MDAHHDVIGAATVWLARDRVAAYLERTDRPERRPTAVHRMPSMVQPIYREDLAASRPSGVAVAIVIAASVFAVVAAIGAAALWAHYGTAVFFEMIKSGIAACI